MGMATIVSLPDNHPMPGERWKLGPCGCIGTVGEGAMNASFSVYNTRESEKDNFVYYLKEDVWNCSGDPDRAHWALDPNAPGAEKLKPQGEPLK